MTDPPIFMEKLPADSYCSWRHKRHQINAFHSVTHLRLYTNLMIASCSMDMCWLCGSYLVMWHLLGFMVTVWLVAVGWLLVVLQTLYTILLLGLLIFKGAGLLVHSCFRVSELDSKNLLFPTDPNLFLHFKLSKKSDKTLIKVFMKNKNVAIMYLKIHILEIYLSKIYNIVAKSFDTSCKYSLMQLGVAQIRPQGCFSTIIKLCFSSHCFQKYIPVLFREINNLKISFKLWLKVFLSVRNFWSLELIHLQYRFTNAFSRYDNYMLLLETIHVRPRIEFKLLINSVYLENVPNRTLNLFFLTPFLNTFSHKPWSYCFTIIYIVISMISMKSSMSMRIISFLYHA